MKTLLVNIKLETPLVITKLTNGDENSAATMDYIPGSAIRGALISQYLQKNRVDLLTDPQARLLFFSDKVLFLNGYISLNGERCLPIPHSLRYEKGNDTPPYAGYNMLIKTPDEHDTQLLKRTGFGLFAPDDENCYLASVALQVQVHNSSGMERKVVEKDNNTVFHYQSLAAGQTFIAPIICFDDHLVKQLNGLLCDSELMTLGASRSAGYGVVKMTCVVCDQWMESQQDFDSTEGIAFYLTSDLIIRDKNGQPSTDFHQALCEYFGRPLPNHPQSQFTSTQLVGGFNRTWHLPLKQEPVLSKGCVFAYPPETFLEGEVEQLVRCGIGERRNEGFGRIAINLITASDFSFAQQSDTSSKQHVLTQASKEIAQLMVNRIYQQRVSRMLSAEMEHLNIKTINANNHQIAKLRQVVRYALYHAPTKGKEQIDAFFQNLKRPQALEGMRILDVRLKIWLDGVYTSEPSSPELIRLCVAGQKPNITDELLWIYRLQKIEMVLDKAMDTNS